MSEETTTTVTEAQVGDPVTKIVSGDSVYPIRDAGALRDGEGTVSGTNLADGSVDYSKLAADVAGDIQELDDGVQALRDSVSRLPVGRGQLAGMDLDTVRDPGCYLVNPSCTNAPERVWGILVVMADVGPNRIQIWSGGKTATRIATGSPSTYGEWH